MNERYQNARNFLWGTHTSHLPICSQIHSLLLPHTLHFPAPWVTGFLLKMATGRHRGGWRQRRRQKHLLPAFSLLQAAFPPVAVSPLWFQFLTTTFSSLDPLLLVALGSQAGSHHLFLCPSGPKGRRCFQLLLISGLPHQAGRPFSSS